MLATHAIYWARTAAAVAMAAYASSSAAPSWAADALPLARVALVLASAALADLAGRGGGGRPARAARLTCSDVGRAASTLLVLTSAHTGLLCMLMQVQQLGMLEAADSGTLALVGTAGVALVRAVSPDAFVREAPLSVLSAGEALTLLAAYVTLRRGYGLNKHLLWAAAGAFQAARALA